MKPRDRVLFATSALLYSGPLYAGLAGYGFETMPLFAAFFMAWLFIVRPGDWPHTREDWRVPRAVAWPMLIFAVQMVVVGFCLVMGRGIGGVFSLTLPMPLAGPVGISLAGILAAWVLRRRTTAPILRVPGESLGIGAGILDVATPRMPGRQSAQAFVEDVAAALADLGPGPAPAGEIDRLAEEIEREGMARPMFEALEAADEQRLPFVQLQARLALSGVLSRDLLGQGRIGRALGRAIDTGDPEVATEVAENARAALAEVPGLADEIPPAVWLRESAEDMAEAAPAAAGALGALADALDPPRAP